MQTTTTSPTEEVSGVSPIAVQQKASGELTRRLAEKASVKPGEYVVFGPDEEILGAAETFVQAIAIYDQQPDKTGVLVMPPYNPDRIRMEQRASIKERF